MQLAFFELMKQLEVIVSVRFIFLDDYDRLNS